MAESPRKAVCFFRLECDAYLSVVATMIHDGKREPNVDPTAKLLDFFPKILPHKREEATEWLHDYLRIVLRIVKERVNQKNETGTVDQDGVS